MKKRFFGIKSLGKTGSSSTTRIPSFFHTQTIIRRRKNQFSSLFIDVNWCSDKDVVKSEAQSFFNNFFHLNNLASPIA